MKLIHISHTDLDGFGCQLVTKEFFKEGMFFNANYGLEVKLTIKKVLEEIIALKDEEILFLISDLNLTIQEAKELDTEILKLNENGYKIKLQLLDHHISGQKCADTYSWYFLDITRSATKIVFDYICSEFGGYEEKTQVWLSKLVDCINAVDIWLENETKNFEFGKALMGMITKAREINNILFPNLSRDYKLFLLVEATKFLDVENAHIKLDNEVHFMKKSFLDFSLNDDTLDNLSAKYLVKTLDDIKEDLTVYYGKYKGLLTYCLGSVSIPANTFLKANSDYDFFMDIAKKGNASFRANGKVDVALMASKLAGGGGHINSSGAKFEDFKDSIDYFEVKAYVQEKLNKLEETSKKETEVVTEKTEETN